MIEAAATYQKGQLYHLLLADLQSDPDQPRKYFDPHALEELTASIREHGILQPVLFRIGNNGGTSTRLCLVAGERRFQAARMAGLTSIPAIFVNGNKAEIALVENLLRRDLTAIEEAEALERIMKEQDYKQEDLTKIIGKAQSTISEILSLNRLPQEIRDECRGNGAVSRRTLAEIAKSKQLRSMRTLYKKYKEKALTQEQIKKQARRVRRTAFAQALDFLGTAQRKIPSLIIDDFADADKETMVVVLTDLKTLIEEKLVTVA